MAEKELTELQQKFLEVLFEEAEGDLHKARRLAGYGNNTRLKDVIAGLEKEIEDATRKYLIHNAPKAVWAIFDTINNPTKMGNKDRIAAAKDILDRSGIKSTEKLEVTGNTPLFILPEKKEDSKS